MRIDNGTLHTSVTGVAQRQYDLAQTKTASVSIAEQESDLEGQTSQDKTSISDKAYAALGAEKASSSGSTSSAEQLEKMIKQLKQQIKEKQDELQRVMTDSSLDDEDRLQQAQAIQAELAILQASLVYAYNSLAELEA
ncbi:FlxA-like family protein [Pseudomonas sp. C11]|uniref:FlxA-like family protein n=1 Tax=Pseudomonas sp. C11 TaxID=3075550 RepID=UPI002AFE43A6|nr:FlxA-like family protein [Pseudomonas sp. C11]